MVPALAPGQYSVLWTSDSSQDGHILHGFYVFTAGGQGASAVGTVSGVVAGSGTPPLDSLGWASALAHWLVLLFSTAWTGALAWQLLVGSQALTHTRGAVAALAAEATDRLGIRGAGSDCWERSWPRSSRSRPRHTQPAASWISRPSETSCGRISVHSGWSGLPVCSWSRLCSCCSR